MNFQSFDFKFLLIFVCIVKSDDEILCEQLSTVETHPIECCVYPQFIDDLTEVTYKCSKLCKALPSPPFYCLKNCKISESGVIVRGKFNGTKVINLFFEGGYKDPTNLTEKWTKIVKKSAKTCEKEVPTNADIVSEDYNYFYTKFIECIRMENFINSPDFSNSTNCKKIKEMMRKCDGSNYPLLHEFFFEDFYYKNNENVTLKWTTRTTTLGTPYPTEETSEETTTEEETDSTEEVEATKTTEVETTNSTEENVTKSAEVKATKPVQPGVTNPAQPETTKPAQPEASKPAQHESTKRSKPEPTNHSQLETRKSTQPEATKPAQPEGTKPAQSEATKPAQPEATKPAQSEATKPAQPMAKQTQLNANAPNNTATQAATMMFTKHGSATSPMPNTTSKSIKSES